MTLYSILQEQKDKLTEFLNTILNKEGFENEVEKAKEIINMYIDYMNTLTISEAKQEIKGYKSLC